MNKNLFDTCVVILNWNSAQDTIQCFESLFRLSDITRLKIILCDNNSDDDSYETIKEHISQRKNINFLSINEQDILNYKTGKEKVILIKNDKNYGYAGGNNKGIKLALQDANIKYIWVLNNDTEVEVDSLKYLINKLESNKFYGVVGSKLVNYFDRKKVQGFGGVLNKKLCTAKEIGGKYSSDEFIDELSYENKIDYVIGASIIFSRSLLTTVGLLCEDYFLYYEEIDICNRAKMKNFKVGIASKSIIYHKHGASTNKGKSEIADFCSVRNRILICKKFYSSNLIFVKLSMILVAANRLRLFQVKRGIKYLKFIFV